MSDRQPLTSEAVKARARELGADLVGITSCAVLEANPPDPQWPQVPSRLSPEMKSAICLGTRMPLGEFLSDDLTCVAHMNQLVMRRIDKVAYALACWLEEEGHYALQLPSDETDPELKRGSYGYLSTRHVAAEAGIGTFGLESNLLSPEYGPRFYVMVVLTTAELATDGRITNQVCIGESCGRCLLACPADAVQHWSLHKRRCATKAQPHGVSSIIHGPLRDLLQAHTDAQLEAILGDPSTYAKWQSIFRLVAAFGVCPRCLEVCPVGDDYTRYLARLHRVIPESTSEKIARLDALRAARRSGLLTIEDAPPVGIRWIGEEGYLPPKKLQEQGGYRRDYPGEGVQG